MYPVGCEIGQRPAWSSGYGVVTTCRRCSVAKRKNADRLAGVGGDAADLPFLEKVLLIIEDRNVGELNAG